MIILFEKEDKTVGIVNPSSTVNFNDVIQRDIPKYSRYVILEEKDLPSQNLLIEFFSALRIDFSSENKIYFDINSCREIIKTKLRNQRIPLFEKNDIELRDAILENDLLKIKIAKDERDRLRNITKLVETVTSLEELINLQA
jgi:hypothetical protein